MSITIENPALNGVDVATLFATLDAVKGRTRSPSSSSARATRWVSGTHSRSTFSGFFGAMQEMEHKHVTDVVSDHPAVLVGQDNGPTPVEYLLHGIAACITAGVATSPPPAVCSSPRFLDRRGRHRPARHPRLRTARYATATSRSRSPSTSAATPTRRPCAAWSSSRGAVPRCTTRSPTPRPVEIDVVSG